MRLYSTLDRLLPRSSFGQKLWLVAFCCTHLPLLALVAVVLLGRGGSAPTVLLSVLGATLVATAALLAAIRSLLAPVVEATSAFERFLVERQPPRLAASGRDEVGRLVAGVQRGCGQLWEDEQRLQQLATCDALTGLLNRGEAVRRLSAVLPPVPGAPVLSAALVDLDHFKSINDRQGHAAGDEVLRAMGRLLARELRADDWAARWGGEEFLLVAVGAGSAEQVLARVRPALLAEHGVTLSAGTTVAAPDDDPDRLLARADAALYRAKESGRDQVVAAG